jgi:hypothetical protein
MSPDRMNVTDDRLTNPANTLNKFIYGGNNPLHFVDPDGRDIVALYEPPSLSSIGGHFMLFVNNPSTGESAIMSYGMVDNSQSGKFLTGIDAPMAATKTYELPQSGDELRDTYAALSIQTTPEEAQDVLNYIKNFSPSSANYILTSNNCATVCRDALKAIGLISPKNSNWTPTSLWRTIFNRYSKNTWQNRLDKSFGIAPSSAGQDYGNPRFGTNTFNFVNRWLVTVQPCTDTWDPKENTLHGC